MRKACGLRNGPTIAGHRFCLKIARKQKATLPGRIGQCRESAVVFMRVSGLGPGHGAWTWSFGARGRGQGEPEDHDDGLTAVICCARVTALKPLA